MTLSRWNRSARNFSSRTAFCKSLLVAARKRTFNLIERVPPTRTNSRSWRTRSNFAWSVRGSSHTSSRKTLPPSATSRRPFFWQIALQADLGAELPVLNVTTLELAGVFDGDGGEELKIVLRKNRGRIAGVQVDHAEDPTRSNQRHAQQRVRGLALRRFAGFG